MLEDDFKFELPDPAKVEFWKSNLLTIAKLLSGAGIGIGALLTAMPESKLSAYISLTLIAISLASAFASWLGSKWQHYRMAAEMRHAEIAAAVASAEETAANGVPTPVTVAVTPADKPNVVVPVTTSEVIKAAEAGRMAPQVSPEPA